MKGKKDRSSTVKKPIYKKWWFWAIIVVILAAIIGGGDEKNDTSQTEAHIYDNAQVKDVMNGLRTKKIGEYSIIEADSDDVTEEALTDWYFNYVSVNDYNWCMILYTDKDNNSGVYAINGMIQKDVLFEKDEYEDYMLGDSSNSIVYGPTDDKTLVEMTFDE